MLKSLVKILEEWLNELYDEYIDYTLEYDLTPYSFEEWLERREK